jgi:hypothetical protein
MVVTWSDDSGPWFDMRVEGVQANAALDSHFDRARSAVAEARSAPPARS